MAPLDWNKLMSLDLAELDNQPDLADDMYLVLSEVNDRMFLSISLEFG